MGSRQSDAQKQYTTAQTSAAQAQTDLAKQMSGFAQNQFTMAQPVYGQALNYYSSLAGAGGSAKMSQVLQPDVNRIGDVYSGAMRTNALTQRGPMRDAAAAELNRQRVEQLGSLGPSQRLAANSSLLQAGGQGFDRALNFGQAGGAATGAASNIYGDLALQDQQRRQNNLSMFTGMGKDWAKLWLPYLLKQGGGGLPASGSGPAGWFSSIPVSDGKG